MPSASPGIVSLQLGHPTFSPQPSFLQKIAKDDLDSQGHSYISFNKVHNNPERIKRFQRALQITSNYVASMKMPRSLAGNAKGHTLACLCGAYRETVEIPQGCAESN